MRMFVGAAIIGTLLLTSCGGDSSGSTADAATTEPATTEPETTAAANDTELLLDFAKILEQGACIAEAPADEDINRDIPSSDDPIWDTVVPCSDPHVVEVTGVIDAPDPDVAYQDFQSTVSAAYIAMRTAVDLECASRREAQLGLDNIPEMENDLITISPLLVDTYVQQYKYDPAPEYLWDVGWTKAICYTYLPDGGSFALDETLEVGRADLDHLRVCQAFPDGASLYVPCTGPHELEYFATLEVTDLVKAGLMGVNIPADDATEEEFVEFYGTTDTACRAIAEHLGIVAPAGTSIFANTWEDVFNPALDPVTGLQSRRVDCMVQPDEGVTLNGSVFNP